MTWDALVAIGTLSLAAVAVAPILIDWHRRRSVAYAVKARLWGEFNEVLISCLKGDFDQVALGRIRELLGSIDVLDEQLRRHVFHTYWVLRASVEAGTATGLDLDDMVDFLEELTYALQVPDPKEGSPNVRRKLWARIGSKREG